MVQGQLDGSSVSHAISSKSSGPHTLAAQGLVHPSLEAWFQVPDLGASTISSPDVALFLIGKGMCHGKPEACLALYPSTLMLEVGPIIHRALISLGHCTQWGLAEECAPPRACQPIACPFACTGCGGIPPSLQSTRAATQWFVWCPQ